MKKRLTAVCLVLAMICALLPQTLLLAGAASETSGTCGDNLAWSFDEAAGTLTVTGSGAMYNWDGTYNTSPWYSFRKSIIRVNLPVGLISIGKAAFVSCEKLTSISIPNSVTSIGADAFAWCSSLTSVTIPKGVISIGDRAFYFCSKLTSAAIPDSVTSIGELAFDSCSSLTSVTIPNGITSISAGLFEYCRSLTSVTIPDSVTSIENLAFCGCSSLTGIKIPDSVTSIGNMVFEGCTSLSSVTIGKGLAVIGTKEFFRCSSLTSITIPGSVTEIGPLAFGECTGLTSVTISDGVKLINSNAFYKCTGLKSITIPDSVTKIADFAFSDCSNLKSITIYSSDCLISPWDSTLGIPGTTTVCGYEGSTAQTYAERYGFAFEKLSAQDPVDQFREGYNLETDSFCFDNISEKISVILYQNAFGLWSGYKIYKENEDGTEHGHCFGMSATTAWLLDYPERVGDFRFFGGTPAKCIDDIQEDTVSSFYADTAKTLIKYGHIFQYSDICQCSPLNDYSGLIKAVKSSINNGGNIVIVSVSHVGADGSDQDGHGFPVVGIRETETDYYLLVNDSNWLSFPHDKALQEMRISKDYSYWQYTVPEITATQGNEGYDYNSNNGRFEYEQCSDDIENIVKALHEQNWTPWKYYFSTPAKLLTSTSPVTESEHVRFIKKPSYGTADSTSREYLYWADTEQGLTVPASTNDQSLSLCDEDNGIEVCIDRGSTVSFSGGTNGVRIENSLKSDNVVLAFLSVEKDGDLRKTIISGVPTVDTVSGKEADGEITVSGLEDIIVYYTDENENVISCEEAEVEKGENASISVDDDGVIGISVDKVTDCGGDPNFCPSAAYKDVPAYGNWAHAGIDFCIDRGIMGSTSTTELTFEPMTACTRSMIVSILYRLENSPAVTYEAKFPDVPAGKWYSDAVIWAYKNGIVSGYDTGMFGTNDKITREQMAMILKGYTEFKGGDTSKRADLSIFPDGSKATWSKDAVSWAVAEGLISGKTNDGQTLLDPRGNAMRSEVASILMRFIEKQPAAKRVCVFDEPQYTGDYGMWNNMKFWSEYIDGRLYVFVQPEVDVDYLAEWYPSLWYGVVRACSENGSYELDYEWDEETDLYRIEITDDIPSGSYRWTAYEVEAATGNEISTAELFFEIADKDTAEKNCVFYEEQISGDYWIWKDLKVWSEEKDGDLLVNIQPQVDAMYLFDAYPDFWYGIVGIAGDNGTDIPYSWDGETDTYTIRVDGSVPTGTYYWYAYEYENETDEYIGEMIVPFAIVREMDSGARSTRFYSGVTGTVPGVTGTVPVDNFLLSESRRDLCR